MERYLRIDMHRDSCTAEVLSAGEKRTRASSGADRSGGGGAVCTSLSGRPPRQAGCTSSCRSV